MKEIKKVAKIHCKRCNKNKESSKFDLEGILESVCTDCKKPTKKLKRELKKQDNPGVYKVRNKITKKVYIGQTTKLQKRKSNYFGKVKGYINHELKKDMELLGIENFTFTVLKVMPNSTLEERLSMEFFFKQKEKDLYNVLPGRESKEEYEKWKANQGLITTLFKH